MNIEFLLQENLEGKVFDISPLVSSIVFEESLASQPGKLTFRIYMQQGLPLNEGSRVRFKYNGVGIFFGYIFKLSFSNNKEVAIVAYDQTRYLKAKDTYVTGNETASRVFERVCKDYKINYKIVDPASYILPARIHDNKTLFDVMQHGIDTTLANAGKWYILRDNYGTVEFLDLEKLKTTLYFGDGSHLQDYNFESNIDQDTFNQIKLVKENKPTGKREVYIVKDSKNIAQWGILQYFEVMDEEANAAQIEAKANQLLKLKNRANKKLKIKVVGDVRIRAGSGVVMGIKDLEDFGVPYNKYFIVMGCSHSFISGQHEMLLELQVI